MSKVYHPYHLVDPSPWPYLSASGALGLTFGVALYMHKFENGGLLALISITFIITIMFLWWRDVVREATYQGQHTKAVQKGLKLGMLLFILSEVVFFVTFFWGYFHSALNPEIAIGSIWPPVGINVLNPLEVPLLNTVILVSSGAAVTWSHHALISGDRKNTILGLLITIILGVFFTALQALEYIEASFTIADSIYGTTFFVATGFHG